jgi:hypothetical protein
VIPDALKWVPAVAEHWFLLSASLLTALIVILSSKTFCGEFSGIS